MGNAGGIDYAAILAGFRNLRRLEICIRPRDITDFNCRESMIRRTRVAAIAWLVRLVERKEGARFESICFRLEMFCSAWGDRNNGLTSLIARLSYKYDGVLPIQEHLHTPPSPLESDEWLSTPFATLNT